MKVLIIKYLIGWLFVGVFLLAGCVELDITPTDKFADETYWTSQEKASSVLSMAYRQMNNPGWTFRDE